MRTGMLHRQALDRSDPIVAQFIAECGLATTAVSIRLIGEQEADVKLQIERLQKAFGSLIQLTQPKQSGRGIEWIAYGTLLG
jgi:hypothetical protein